MKSRISIQGLILIVLLVLSVFSFPLLIVWRQSTMENLMKKSERIRLETGRVRGENSAIRLRLEQMKRNNRIEKTARERLGLDYPDPQTIRFIENDQAGR